MLGWMKELVSSAAEAEAEPADVLAASVHSAAAAAGNTFPVPGLHATFVLSPHVSGALVPQSAVEGTPLSCTHKHI